MRPAERLALAALVSFATLATARAEAAPDVEPAAKSLPQPRPDGAAPEGAASRATLDYSNGTFYMRSADDNLILATGGRLHVDTYAFAGPGASAYHRANGTGLAPRMFFRRFVLEGGGIVRKRWFFWFGGNFAPTQVDSSGAPKSTAGVYDGFIGYQPTPALQLYVGQFNAPFTMENVTSSRWLDLMERALVVRTVATPYNKDLGVMFWGATADRAAPLEYQVGVFGGDGMNRPNVDNRIDAKARVVFRPLASREDALHRLHVGVSGRGGSRDDAYVLYDAPSLSTPGGYAFWSPAYRAVDGSLVHVLPSGNQAAVAGELYVPLERVDLKAEVVYVNDQRREAPALDRNLTLRRGALEGVGGYAQVSYWPIGSPRVNGHPAGRYLGLRPPRDRGAELPFGLQVVLRAETMRLSYDGNARTPVVPDGAISARTDRIAVDAAQLGVNYWATKHVRLTAEYALYAFRGLPPSAGLAETNQAAAPGAAAEPADPSADHLHEIAVRLGLAL